MAKRQEPPPEIMAALQALQGSDGGLSGREAGPDLLELVNSVQQDKGERPKTKSQHVVPEAGFVIKTADVDGSKVFINVCHARQVPAPSNWSQGKMPSDISAALDKARGGATDDTETVRFPLSMGPLRPDLDHKGDDCSVIDVVFNSDVLREAAGFRPLKAFLVELCKEWVAQKTGRKLQDQYKLPKMRYKGSEIQPQDMRMDRESPLVTELSPDDPSFPLLSQRSPSASRDGKAAPAAAASAAAAAVKLPRQHPPAPTSDQLPSSSPVGGRTGKQHSQPSPRQDLEPLGSNDSCQEQQPGVRLPSAPAAAPLVEPARTGSAGLQQLDHEVSYEGRPVQSILLNINFPKKAASNKAAAPFGADSDLSKTLSAAKVEVCHESVKVAASGFSPLEIALPLAVTADGACAILDSGKRSLHLKLPYLPLASFVKQVRGKAPLSFGALPLKSSSYLELES
ncbi:hypothetical protein WJX74_008282 [Apatococcus lobatus]|uniref:PIH1 N-terminal domain-containing protein n=1 Tax=Apatococcus lobatus TaxID=904363 RepID=A0AAW1RT43_9CHLO